MRLGNRDDEKRGSLLKAKHNASGAKSGLRSSFGIVRMIEESQETVVIAACGIDRRTDGMVERKVAPWGCELV